MRKKIVFLHVPKTGGTSVHDYLVGKFPRDKVCPHRFNTLRDHTQEELNQYRYFSGHFDMDAIEHIEGEKDVFSFFRDPKNTVLSLYYFWRSHKQSVIEKNNLVGPRLAKSMGLLEFLNSANGPIPSNINNYTTRVLIGKMYCGPGGKFLYPEDEVFDRAVEKIDQMKTFGIMDCYEQSYRVVLNNLGFEPPEVVPHARDSKNNSEPYTEKVVKEEITEEIDAAIKSVTSYDQKVYEYARDRYFKVIQPDS